MRTAWTTWLSETYAQIRTTRWIPKPEETLIWRHRQAAAMIVLLLQHGADPQCMICIIHHRGNTPCRLIALDQLMGAIVPPDCLTMLRDLRKLCSNQATSTALRRNQRRRAMRCYLISEQFCESLAKDASAPGPQNPYWGKRQLEFTLIQLAHYGVENMANVRPGSCNRCLSHDSALLTVMWCLDCGDRSILCFDCLKQDPSEQLTLKSSCGDCTGDYSTVIGKHTRVTFVILHLNMSRRSRESFEQDAVSICTRYPAAQAIASMKGWYAKDPIDPDLTFEDVVRSTRAASPPSSDQTPSSRGVTGEVLEERGGKSR